MFTHIAIGHFDTPPYRIHSTNIFRIMSNSIDLQKAQKLDTIISLFKLPPSCLHIVLNLQ